MAGARYVALEHVRRPVSFWRDLRGLIELIGLCLRERPLIVHANSSKAGILGRIAARIACVPVRIFTVHGWAFAQYHGVASALYLLLDRLARPLTTHFICVSQSTREAGIAARTCGLQNTSVIPNSVDVAATPRASLDGDPPRVVSVGRLKAPKDFVGLVRALSLADAPYRAAIVGEGPDRSAVVQALHTYAASEHIALLGERSDVAEQLAQSDVFVLASRSEGMPLSVLEAMAAGLPVVASSVGGIPELVVSGETGLLVRPGDIDALAAALHTVLADRELRRAMGDAGRARAQHLFDLPGFRAAHVRLYREALSRA